MRKSSKIIALLVTLVMLVCALAVAINASTELPSVTVADKTNSYDMNAIEAKIHDETGKWFRDNSDNASKIDAYCTKYQGFEGISYKVDATMDEATTNPINVFAGGNPNFFEYKIAAEKMTGDAVAEVVGTEANHYLRFSSTKAGEGTIRFWYDVAQRTTVVNAGNPGGSPMAGVYDFDFTADQYVKAGGGLTTDIAEAENGGKLAYSEKNGISFYIGKGKITISFEYDESSNRWYVCYGDGKMVLRPELGAWNHITVVNVPFSDNSVEETKNKMRLATYVYLDGELVGFDEPFGVGTIITDNSYPSTFGFHEDNNPYTPDDMSLCLDNLTFVHYNRCNGSNAGVDGIVTYGDLFTKQYPQVYPESLNGTLKVAVWAWGDTTARPADEAVAERYGRLGYAVYSDEYTYPAGTTYAATITRGAVVDGYYGIGQAIANLQAGDTLTIRSGLVYNYKGNASFTVVCDEGAITLPRDSEMALVRTANGYNVVAQSTIVDEVAQLMLFPTYEDYQAAISEKTFTSHNFTVIQGAPLDPEDTNSVNYPDHYVWIIVDPTNEFAVVASDLSASDLVSAEVIAAAEAAAANEATLMIYPAPKASITVNWYASKDAATPFATATYKDGETIVVPDTTGVEELKALVPFNEYVDLIFGGTFVDAEGNAFVAGTTASASVDYYAVIDTPQIKAEYAKMGYMNLKLTARQIIGQVYAPITNEEGVKWSVVPGKATVEIGGKTYGMIADNNYLPYSVFGHDKLGDKSVTVTVNGKTSAPASITLPTLRDYYRYVLEHKSAYTDKERQLILDLVQYQSLFMSSQTGKTAYQYVGEVYKDFESECTKLNTLTFAGDTKYDLPETLPTGINGITLALQGSGAYSFWKFAVEVDPATYVYDASNPITMEYTTWASDGTPTTAVFKLTDKLEVGGKTYYINLDNANSMHSAALTEDVVFTIGETVINYNLATYIQNVEAADGDATVVRAMYAFSKSLYAYITAPVD